MVHVTNSSSMVSFDFDVLNRVCLVNMFLMITCVYLVAKSVCMFRVIKSPI